MKTRSWLIVVSIGIGIAAFRLTAWAAFRTDIWTSSSEPYLFSLAAQVVAIIVLIALGKQYNAQSLLRGITPLSIICVIAALVVIKHPELLVGEEGWQTIVLIGSVMHGFFSAVLLLGWGILTCSIAPRWSTLGVALGFFIYAIFTALLGDAPDSVMVLVVGIIVSILSGFLLLLGLRKNGSFISEVAQERDIFRPWASFDTGLLKKFPWGVITILLLCTLSTGLMGGLSTETEFYLISANLFWPMVYGTLFLALLFCFYVLKYDSPERLWPLFVLFVFLGLLVFSALGSRGIDVATSFMVATQNCTRLFFWILIPAIVYTNRLPALPFFGIGNIVICHGYILIEFLCRPFFNTLDLEARTMTSILVAVAMALILIVVSFILLTRRSSMPEIGAVGNTQNNMQYTVTLVSEYVEAANRITKRYALSPREREVLEYLLQGYTYPLIAEKMFISLNTVQSHQRSIYQKIGIHKKQDLIRIVESSSVDADSCVAKEAQLP